MINLHPQILQRANTVTQWLPLDSPENYKTKTSLGPNLYLPNSFDYKFNEYGFRCDNFNQESDLPIVFLGCSMTEGIGLPVEATWSHQLLTKIRNKTSKNIPYWNLSVGGASVDNQARHLYWFSKLHKVKFVFALLPIFHRREYCLYSNEEKNWGITFGNCREVDHLFIDDNFKNHQTARSFMIIDSILDQNNTQMHCSKWKFTIDNIDDNNEELFIKDNFPNFNFFEQDIPRTDFARDGMHVGPNYHSTLVELFWDRINHLF